MRPITHSIWWTCLLLTVITAACGGAGLPAAPQPLPTRSPVGVDPSMAGEPPPYGPGAVVGRFYDIHIGSHCGIDYLSFDGRLWLREGLTTTSDAPAPDGWGINSQPGQVALIHPNRALFRPTGLWPWWYGTNDDITYVPTDVSPLPCA